MPFSTFYPNYVIVEQQHYIYLGGGEGGEFVARRPNTTGRVNWHPRPSTTTGQKRKRKLQEDHTPMMGKNIKAWKSGHIVRLPIWNGKGKRRSCYCESSPTTNIIIININSQSVIKHLPEDKRKCPFHEK
jgi:hypothetical protein